MAMDGGLAARAVARKGSDPPRASVASPDSRAAPSATTVRTLTMLHEPSVRHARSPATTVAVSSSSSASSYIGPHTDPSSARLVTTVGEALLGTVPATHFPRAVLSCCTLLGKRDHQEDRALMIPRVNGQDGVMLLQICDGTVGDAAVETAIRHLPEAGFLDACAAAVTGAGYLRAAVSSKIASAVTDGYRVTDEHVLDVCRAHEKHYSSCTSVTALVCGDLVTIAHLGDSKVVLGRESNGEIVGKYLTVDHKPDMPAERARIEKAGGTVVYLHGGKPFLRGGDFVTRQARGGRPMQLNYSRAFGGKDLKPYGLVALPDVLQFQLSRDDRLLILASDGLWDVVTATDAVQRALTAMREGDDAPRALCEYALELHRARGTADNVSVMIALLR